MNRESGRYNNIPFDKRTCNGQHYLMQCSNTMLNKEIRYSFIQKLHQINSSFSLFNDQDLFFINHLNEKQVSNEVSC